MISKYYNSGKFSLGEMLYLYIYFKPHHFYKRIKEQVEILSREEIQMKISIQWQIDDDFWAGFEAYLQDHKDLYVPESLDENKKIALLNKTSCLPFLAAALRTRRRNPARQP